MSRSRSPPANTLLEATSSQDGAEADVYDVLDRPGETNLLVLSYDDGPESWFHDWQTRVGDLPTEVGFVHVGVEMRSTATTSVDANLGLGSDHGPLLIDVVSDPTDLSRLGVAMSEYLESWAGNGRQTVVYLDSLTKLLEHVDSDRAYKFLHLLAGRVGSVDGRGYYRLDPSAHDDQSLAVVRELADSVVDLDASPQK